MNILILSCGTRYKLVEYFKDRSNGFDRVVVTDCSEYAPALYVADKYYIVSRMDSEGYIDELIDICKKEYIDVVLPLQENELLLISKNKGRFENTGIKAAVSEYASVCMCKDKYNMYKFLNKNEVPVIETQLLKDVIESYGSNKELIVKPRCGAGSVGVMKVKTTRLLEALYEETKDELIVQPYIDGREYGIDVYVDYLSSEIKGLFCKEKLRMRAGETEKSKSVKKDKLEALARKVVRLLNLKGAIDIDVIEKNGEFYILEINPRFGGGYPHAYECGVNFPKLMAVNCKGNVNKNEMIDYKENVVALKYSNLIIR